MPRRAAPAAEASRSTRCRTRLNSSPPKEAADATEPVLPTAEEPKAARVQRAARPVFASPPGTTRTDTKTIEDLATRALVCFYHPAVDRSVRSQKQDWAEFFGTTKQRFMFWERKLADSIRATSCRASLASL
eukprot:6641051-Prymnesium_polylepis.1